MNEAPEGPVPIPQHFYVSPIPEWIDGVLSKIEKDTTNRDIWRLAFGVMRGVSDYYYRGLTREKIFRGKRCGKEYTVSGNLGNLEIRISGPDLLFSMTRTHYMRWEGDKFPEHVLEVLRAFQGRMTIIH